MTVSHQQTGTCSNLSALTSMNLLTPFRATSDFASIRAPKLGQSNYANKKPWVTRDAANKLRGKHDLIRLKGSKADLKAKQKEVDCN